MGDYNRNSIAVDLMWPAGQGKMLQKLFNIEWSENCNLRGAVRAWSCTISYRHAPPPVAKYRLLADGEYRLLAANISSPGGESSVSASRPYARDSPVNLT